MNTNDVEMLVRIVLVLVVCVGLFIILREAVLWYWKINKIVDLLETQNAILKAILKKEEKEKIDQ